MLMSLQFFVKFWVFNITYLKEYFVLQTEILEEVIVVRPFRHDIFVTWLENKKQMLMRKKL